MTAKYGVDDVVEFSPRVTGGHVVGVVTGVIFDARAGYAYTVRITDGTWAWPTGVTEGVSEDMLT